MNALLELVERIEKVEGPDRALDVEIAVAVDWRWPDWEEGESTVRDRVAAHGLEWLIDRATNGMNSMWRGIPAYTASIDAAMTLVPEGAVTFLASQERHSLRWKWELRHGFGVRSSARAATPALALTAAALRSLAAQGVEPRAG